MLVLHTADWHLGTRFHDQRRGDDEDHALDQLLAICARRRVDAVLVAGDVFDHANPGAEEQKRYYRFLSRLGNEAGVATVVVTAGNHDSALRLEGPRELLTDLGIHIVGRWRRDAPADDILVPLKDRSGEIRALCAAVPYLRDGDLRLAEVGETAIQVHARYARALGARYGEARGAARREAPELPLVIMGHCFVQGADLGGGERPIQVGNLALLDAAEVAGDAAYLALGHLHRPQDVGARHWRYCGSLLPTGFDETETRREAVLVDLPDAAGVPAQIERFVLEPFRRYLRLRGTVDDVAERIDQLPRATDDEPTPWCEAVVTLEGPSPGLAQVLADRAQERGWGLVSVRRDVHRRSPTPPGGDAGPALEELEPEDVFERRHQEEYGTLPDDELRTEFRTLLETVTRGGDGSELPPGSADAGQGEDFGASGNAAGDP